MTTELDTSNEDSHKIHPDNRKNRVRNGERNIPRIVLGFGIDDDTVRPK